MNFISVGYVKHHCRHKRPQCRHAFGLKSHVHEKHTQRRVRLMQHRLKRFNFFFAYKYCYFRFGPDEITVRKLFHSLRNVLSFALLVILASHFVIVA